jgi:two-component system chemotaxis response regulator CheY
VGNFQRGRRQGLKNRDFGSSGIDVRLAASNGARHLDNSARAGKWRTGRPSNRPERVTFAPDLHAGPSLSVYENVSNFLATEKAQSVRIELVSMLHHRALGRDLEKLVVSVVDPRQPMRSMMRAMLAAIGTGRIETYAGANEAFEAMSYNPPDLVIAAASMQPVSGPELIRAMRRADAGPLCFVPAMIMSAHARPSLVEEALRAGAHQVLVLPTSASTLYRRLDWLLNDDRPFELDGDNYVVAGMEERLSLSFPRPSYVPATGPASLPLAIGQTEGQGNAPFALRMRAVQN